MNEEKPIHPAVAQHSLDQVGVLRQQNERLAGIIAEIVTALGIDVGDCYLGPGPDICALDELDACREKVKEQAREIERLRGVMRAPCVIEYPEEVFVAFDPTTDGAGILGAARTLSEATSLVASCSSPAQQPSVAWQFQDNDGQWRNGQETNNHRANTEAAGYPVRDLYPGPVLKAQQPSGVVLPDSVSAAFEAWDAIPASPSGFSTPEKDSALQKLAAELRARLNACQVSAGSSVSVERKALADFIEYSVPGPYGCDEKWFADKKVLMAAVTGEPVSAGRVDERAAGGACNCTDGRCGTRPAAFAREMRYVVLKLNKLDEKQLARLNELLNVSGPAGEALPTVECVVVEHDWPEYQHVWKMIEARVTGQARAALTAGRAAVPEGWKSAAVYAHQLADMVLKGDAPHTAQRTAAALMAMLAAPSAQQQGGEK